MMLICLTCVMNSSINALKWQPDWNTLNNSLHMRRNNRQAWLSLCEDKRTQQEVSRKEDRFSFFLDFGCCTDWSRRRFLLPSLPCEWVAVAAVAWRTVGWLTAASLAQHAVMKRKKLANSLLLHSSDGFTLFPSLYQYLKWQPRLFHYSKYWTRPRSI